MTLQRIMMSRATDSSLRESSDAIAHEAKDCESTLVFRNLERGDAHALGQLLYDAYKGTVDDEGQSIEDAIIEAEETIAGKYGELIREASYVVLDGNTIVSTCVATNYKEIPLVAFAATLPSYQGKGLARKGMIASIRSLADLGRDQVRLVVTETNARALSLYESLGFTPVDKT